MTGPSVLAQTVPKFVLDWGPLALLIVIAGVYAYLFERLLLSAVRSWVHKTTTELDDIIIRAIHPALLFLVFVVTIWVGVEYALTNLPAEAVVFTERMTVAIVVVMVAVVVSRLLYGLLRFRARKSPTWQPVASLGGRIGSAVVYVVAFLLILDYYGLSITPLLTSLGLAGLAVALALQDTLSNFFAGIWIQTGRSLRPGHFVRLEDVKLEGYVVEVGWRTTKIRTLPNNIIVIPNAKIAQTVITDYYLPETRMALLIPVSVNYGTDPALVEKILVEETMAAAETTPGLLKEPAPFVRFIPGFGDYALQFTLICQVREFVDQFLAQHEIRKRIIARFEKEGVQIPFPTQLHYQAAAGRAMAPYGDFAGR